MQKTVIVNAHVISPAVDLEGATVVIEGRRISQVTARRVAARPDASTTVVDVGGQYVMPGFIDVHTHGALTYDFCDADEKAIFEVARAKLQEGVTTFLPTTLTVSHEELVVAAKNARKYAEAGQPYAKAPGIHLEGPFINVKCCGAQNPKYVRKPSVKELREIAKVYPVKQISYAVEADGGAKFARECLKLGVVPSCGHTAAKLKDLMPAYRNGLRHMTHFCNQMTPLHHREIGMVGAGFLIEDLNTEVICDRIHLCDDMLRLVFTRRNLAHVQMITDSLRCSHCKDGYEFLMGGIKVKLQNGEARLEAGNLAGSTLWMGNGLKNVHDVTGIPLKDLVRCTSWNQAIEQGWGKTLGKVEKGYTADLVVINPRSWKPSAVFVDGQQRI
ncbi:MAG: N-acetylglucosamine-6-phosphate deacetylase, partial [Kiritimatiellae bacterium]|nr:N-acetylglucosamine-6-phosphate deacetylase [Kiritimatiellia bacterium]